MHAKEVLKHGLIKLGFLSKWRYMVPTSSDYNSSIASRDQGNNIIANAIISKAPFMASRFGDVELAVLGCYLDNHGKHKQMTFPRKFLRALCINAGFFPFPPTTKDIERFCGEYLNAISVIDYLGVWMSRYESFVVNNYMKSAALFPLQSLEPYYFENPYSRALEGLRVLVIHPYKDSILSQYSKNRARLFRNPNVLPEFELEVMRAVQSIALSPTPYATWFDALQAMKDEISNRDFDVAIVGAGAYGLPLAAHIKRMGKQVIHMGGATQVYFGIKGSRWESRPEIACNFNEYWVYPKENERPANATLVEGGCYW